MTRLKRDVRITYAAESDFNVGPVGSAEDRDVETREEMDAVLALCAAEPKLSWEAAKAKYFRGTPTRYGGYGQGPQAVAGRPGLHHDDGFHHHFGSHKDGSETRVGQGNDVDINEHVGQTVVERLGLRLTPAQPWVKPVLEEPGGGLGTLKHEQLRAATEYANLHRIGLLEAADRLGFKLHRLGGYHAGASPQEARHLME